MNTAGEVIGVPMLAAANDRDRPHPDTAALAPALAAAHPGDQISLTINRSSQHLTVQVRLGELPGS